MANTLTENQLKRFDDLLAPTTKAVLGNCMFCSSPVMRASLGPVVDFQLIIQRAVIQLDDLKLTKEIQGFLICRDCGTDSHKLTVANNLAEVVIDYHAVTRELTKAIQKRDRENRIRDLMKEDENNGKTKIVGQDGVDIPTPSISDSVGSVHSEGRSEKPGVAT